MALTMRLDVAGVLRRLLPERIASLRNLRRWSQLRLSQEARISQSGLNRLESGMAQDVLLSTLIKISQPLQINPGYLLDYCGENGCISPMCPNRITHQYKVKRDGRKCIACQRVIPVHEPHLLTDCITDLYDQGRSTEHLSVLFGLSVAVIIIIVREGYQTQRIRRGGVAAFPYHPS